MSSGLKSPHDRFSAEQYLSNTGIGRTVVSFSKRAQIFAQGDDCDTLFHVISGVVKLTVLSDTGKVATIALLNESDLMGEQCLLREARFMSATATALTDCVLLRIARAELIRVLRDEPVMSAFFVSYLLRRNQRIQSDLIDQLFNSSERRLARTLLLLARFGEDGELEKMVPHVSQETLAAMVGCTRSRVNFFLNRFRKLGFIEYSGRIRVKKGLLQFLLVEGH